MVDDGRRLVGQGHLQRRVAGTGTIRTSSTTSTASRWQAPTARGRIGCRVSYELPYGVTVSGTWQYQAGAPEETTVVVTNATIALPQGNQTLRVREFGDVRFPTVAGLDLSFRKTFRAGSRTISPRIDIFNATNESTVTARITQLGPTYGTYQRHSEGAADQGGAECGVLDN